jgi:hypothetical protein
MGEYTSRAANAAAWLVVIVVTVVAGCGMPFSGLGDVDSGEANDAGSTFDGAAITQPGDDASAAPDAPSRDAPSLLLIGRDADPGPLDGAADSSTDGGHVGAEGGGDSGCGTTTTITSCGACSVSCDTLTGTPSCDGHSCLYACSAGRSDCNAAQAPDTDGCECATPACCGTACQTTHSDGVGGSFYDCVPLSTYTQSEAYAACIEHSGSASFCGILACGDGHAVCDFGSPLPDCTCWGYDRSIGGHVYAARSCSCPLSSDPRWF